MEKDKKIPEETFEPEEKVDVTEQTEHLYAQRPILLRLPKITIIADEVKLGTIIQAFQNLSYIGEMKQRWEEIKKLQSGQFVGA